MEDKSRYHHRHHHHCSVFMSEGCSGNLIFSMTFFYSSCFLQSRTFSKQSKRVDVCHSLISSDHILHFEMGMGRSYRSTIWWKMDGWSSQLVTLNCGIVRARWRPQIRWVEDIDVTMEKSCIWRLIELHGVLWRSPLPCSGLTEAHNVDDDNYPSLSLFPTILPSKLFYKNS